MAREVIIGRFGYDFFFNGKKAREDIQRMNRSFGSLKKSILTVIGGKTVTDMARFGQELSLMSTKTGMSVSKLSSLRSAFISAGSGAKGFERVINSINEGLLGISVGRGDFAARLGMLGISPYTAGGTLKSGDQILYDLSDWAKSMRNTMSDRDILYMLESYFGIDTAQGKKMLAGSSALKAFEAETVSRVGSISEKSSEQLESLRKNIDDFWSSIKNATATAVAGSTEVLNPFINGIREITTLASKHEDLTKTVGAMTGFVAILATIGSALKMIGMVLGITIGGVKVAVLAVYGAIGGVLGWIAAKTHQLFGWIFQSQEEELRDRKAEILDDKKYYNEKNVFDYNKLKKDYDKGLSAFVTDDDETGHLGHQAAYEILRALNPDANIVPYMENFEGLYSGVNGDGPKNVSVDQSRTVVVNGDVTDEDLQVIKDTMEEGAPLQEGDYIILLDQT